MRMVDREIPTRARVHLPEAAMRAPVLLQLDTPLRLATGHQLNMDQPAEGDTVTFEIGGTGLSCHVALLPALRLLRGARPTTLNEMGVPIQPVFRLPLRMLVETLIARGAIWAEPLKLSGTATGRQNATRAGTDSAAQAENIAV
jgi:hypothetical protein